MDVGQLESFWSSAQLPSNSCAALLDADAIEMGLDWIRNDGPEARGTRLKNIRGSRTGRGRLPFVMQTVCEFRVSETERLYTDETGAESATSEDAMAHAAPIAKELALDSGMNDLRILAIDADGKEIGNHAEWFARTK
jgi:hypothetical protein